MFSISEAFVCKAYSEMNRLQPMIVKLIYTHTCRDLEKCCVVIHFFAIALNGAYMYIV